LSLSVLLLLLAVLLSLAVLTSLAVLMSLLAVLLPLSLLSLASLAVLQVGVLWRDGQFLAELLCLAVLLRRAVLFVWLACPKLVGVVDAGLLGTWLCPAGTLVAFATLIARLNCLCASWDGPAASCSWDRLRDVELAASLTGPDMPRSPPLPSTILPSASAGFAAAL